MATTSDKLTQLSKNLAEAADRLSEMTATPSWRPGRSHIEQTRNVLRAASRQLTEEIVPEIANTSARLAIILEGGLVQSVVSDNPEALAGVEVVVIDYDVEGSDRDEIGLAIYRGETIEQATIEIPDPANPVRAEDERPDVTEWEEKTDA